MNGKSFGANNNYIEIFKTVTCRYLSSNYKLKFLPERSGSSVVILGKNVI